jgi:cbb3-type cytochrome oxidase maturation protein
MDILYLLIPLSALLVLAIIGVFGWALYRGQFEDLEHEGERILQPDGPGPDAPAEERQQGRDSGRDGAGAVSAASDEAAARGQDATGGPPVDADQAPR